MDEAERLLRHLALNDEESLRRVLVIGTVPKAAAEDKVDWLVRLGALLALGAATASLRTAVEHAIQAGASEPEVVDVLVSIGPAVGLARLVAAAPRLATALGYDTEVDDEGFE